MVDKNIGTFDEGDYTEITHFVAVSAQGPSVDVNPLLIPKGQVVPAKSLAFQNPTPSTASTSAQCTKGSYFRMLDDWDVDRVYFTHDAASADVLEMRLARIVAGAISEIIHSNLNVATGSGSIISVAVDVPKFTVAANTTIAVLFTTAGKASSFATRIRNSVYTIAGVPSYNFGYIQLANSAPNVATSVTLANGAPYAVGLRLREP